MSVFDSESVVLRLLGVTNGRRPERVLTMSSTYLASGQRMMRFSFAQTVRAPRFFTPYLLV